MTCTAKHTKYQPTDEEWKCPKCGAKAHNEESLEEGWIIDISSEFSEDCDLLHEDDELCCYTCQYACSGKAFAAKVAKQKNLVTCPCCKGKGWVDPSKVKTNE